MLGSPIQNLPEGGLHVVQGELSTLVNSMRRTFKWSSQVYQDEEQDILFKNLNTLKENLNKSSWLTQLDLMSILGPFLEVIRSEDTTGPVTELALSSVFKFLSYGLIDPSHESAIIAVESIADAVTHARFVGTDPSSDEVVLMKILQVLRMLILSPAGILLSNESICEIMQSCFRICFETRLSELLRKSAEHCLSEMVRLLFLQLPQFPVDDNKGSINYNKLKMRTASYDPSRSKKKSRSPKVRPKTLAVTQDFHTKVSSDSRLSPSVSTPKEDGGSRVETQLTSQNAESTENIETNGETSSRNLTLSVESLSTASEPLENDDRGDRAEAGESLKINEESEMDNLQMVETPSDPVLNSEEIPKDYVNTQGVRFISSDSLAEKPTRTHVPYGLPCVRELLRFLISLINPLERQNSETMIQIGLRLLTVAIETSGDCIGTIPSLLILIQDETCRYLFSLLNSERLSLIAAATRLCFLLFESMRCHLKFQLETYLTKLMEIVVSESPKLAFERRLVALEAVNQLWRLPGLITELYLNYDCDAHTSDLFEDFMKQLSKNVFPVTGIYATHLLSLDTLLIVIDSIEAHCLSRLVNQIREGDIQQERKDEDGLHLPPAARKSRFEPSANIPSHEELMAIKHKKKLLISGADHFNSKPGKGIEFLQENGLLSNPLDAHEVGHFLRENPRLDKKMIGEYISNRKNLAVLESFVRSFDFHSLRIDEALRLYLETFRLPGEAPLISLLMEQFADHWFNCNNAPFANTDAAFTLAYAVIMLNVDQHNHNVKKQNIPMTCDEFKRNLSGVNDKQDFDHAMLDEIYHAIRNEEIVMPAEQTGIVKENYLWKVLLRRGATKDGLFLHCTNGLFDHDLFALSWGPIVAALSFILDKSNERTILDKALTAFKKISTIASHYAMSDVFDHVILTLVKYTTLCHSSDAPLQQAISFGNNSKAQLTTITVFNLIHKHGDILRDGWRQLVEMILQFYRLKILPESLIETEDFFDPTIKVKLVREETPSQRSETSLLSSLYLYIALSDPPSGRGNSPEDQEALRRAKDCVVDCNIDQLIADSKFLQTNALQQLIKVLVSASDIAGANTHEHLIIFVLELLVRITVQNRDRVTCIWNPVRDHIYGLVMGASAAGKHFVLERSIVALLRLTGRLMRREDVAPIVLQSLRMLLLLKPQILSRVARQIAYGLHELLKTGAANVHTTGDWTVLFTLLECVGAGAKPPSVRGASDAILEPALSDSEISTQDIGNGSDRGYTSDSELYESRIPRSVPVVHGSNPELNAGPPGGGGWILVGREGEFEHLKGRQAPGREYNIVHDRELLQHDPLAFVKSCESLAFLVRDVAHITPENFESAVQCIRTFVEASLNGGRRMEKKTLGVSDNRNRKKMASPKRSETLHRTKSGPQLGSSYDADESDDEELPTSYQQVPIQLLDLMHTLHTRAAQIYQWWATESGVVEEEEFATITAASPSSLSLWSRGWCPLLQGIARLCCDCRKQVRTTAITYLQRSLLVHDLQSLTASEWEACFNTVLFPLLSKLLEPNEKLHGDHHHWEETRMRAATLLSKVFLQHLGPLLQLPTFTALWLTILDFMDKYMHAEHNDLLAEAIPEMMKNLLLVMETAGVFGTPELDQNQLWSMTWDRIFAFLPGLREEVSRSKNPTAREKPTPEPVVQVESPLDNKITTGQDVINHELEESSRQIANTDVHVESMNVPDCCDGNKLRNIEVETAVNQRCCDKNQMDSTINHQIVAQPDAASNSGLPGAMVIELNENNDRTLGGDNLLTSLSNLLPKFPIPLPVSEENQAQLWAGNSPTTLPVFPPTGSDNQLQTDDASSKGNLAESASSHLPLLSPDVIEKTLPTLPLFTAISKEEDNLS